MMILKHILYVLLWILFILLSFHWFPVYRVSVVIPAALLMAIGGWLYGVYGSLLIILPFMLYFYFLLEYYGNILEIYQAKAFGIGIIIIVSMISGTTKRMRDQVKIFSILLDQKATERTRELDALTTRLIAEDEKLRIDLAHHIHNGLGQYLTGIFLYSSSLETELRENPSEETDLAASLVESAQTNLNLTRKASRILFPIRISETGFEAALDELTSYFTETTGLQFDVQLDHDLRHLPDQTILHLYRITYEGILSALHYGSPSHISITLSCKNGTCSLLIENNSSAGSKHFKNSTEMELMRYRAKQINGQLSSKNKTMIECRVPYNPLHVNTSGNPFSHA